MFIDHVAVVLRFDSSDDCSDQEIYILETTCNVGARIKRWSDTRKHLGTFYAKIVLRHLNFNRSESSLLVLEEFLKAVNGA